MNRLKNLVPLDAEDQAALEEAYSAVKAGKVHPFDQEAANARADALIASALAKTSA